MVSELSILIPVYNYNVTSLVKSLHQQCQALPISFEIRLYDDGSTADILKQNKIGLQAIPNTVYKLLPKHLGRSAIRNKLAQDALYPNLLFLDNDSELVNPDFIGNYLQDNNGEEIVIGGTIYSQIKPLPAYRLHWQYGRHREQRTAAQRNIFPYQSFHLNNIFIPKSLMLYFPLQELQFGYGHEDSLLGSNLQRAGVKVKHIDNPVLHAGLEKTEVYLQKTKEAALNLYYLYKHHKIDKDIKLIRLYKFLRKSRLLPFVMFIYNKFERVIVKQLFGNSPYLWLLDFYKLYNFASAEAISLVKN